MNFDLSEEQIMLKDQASRLFCEKASGEHLRVHLTGAAPMNDGLWSDLVEMGVLGAAIPEAFGGLGLEPLDLAMVFEEAGRTCAPVPLFSSVGLAAEALALSSNEAAKAAWLPRLASGEAIGCFAHVERAGPAISALVETAFADGVLTGSKFPVADAGVAHVAVVAARIGDEAAVVLVALDNTGVTRTFRSGVDELRPHYILTFDGVPGELLARGAEAETLLSALYDRAAVYAAFEAVGGAEACLFMARDYALERKVFSRPIGGFQAIKHRLADMLCLVELARSNAWFAAWALVHAPDEAPLAAAAARISAVEAYEMAARENLQIHGGIGYTWEADCHFYYRRARLLAAHIGTAAEWSDRLVRLLGEVTVDGTASDAAAKAA
ncbi:MAG: hypothetical protein JWR59_797 [Brevundimonas sp.]|nr:hypothetical protein [Brevundimonas sp.]